MFVKRNQDANAISSKQHCMAVAVVAMLGIAIYANSIDVPFFFDDRANIVDNTNIHVAEWDVSEFLEAATAGRNGGGNRRPLAYLSFALNYYFSGVGESESLDPIGFHIVNIAIHLSAGILAYFLAIATLRLWDNARRSAGSHESLPICPMALFAACLFVAHPIQTQAVTYVVQRMTSMATMFYLASLLLYIYGRGSQRPGARAGYWVAASLTAVLALASKQIAVTLPVIVLLYEWFFFRNLDVAWMKKAALRFVLPAFVVVIGLGLLYTDGHPIAQLEQGYESRDFTMADRLWTQPRVIMFHVSQIIYPAPSRLSLLHSIETSRTLLDPPSSLLSLLLIMAMFVLALWLARRERIVAFGILWFLINLALESSFLALEMVYEHRIYLPLFGLTLAASYLLFITPSRYRAYALVAAVLATVLCAQGTIQRNEVWQNRLTFWRDLVAKTDASLEAARNSSDEVDTPARHNRHAARIYNNYGQVLGQLGRLDEARIEFVRAVKIDPTYPESHFNLATAHTKVGENQAALKEFTKAIEHQPKYVAAYFQRGKVHQGLGHVEKAMADYTSAIERSKDFSQARYERAQGYMFLRKFDHALEDLNETIRLQPGDPNPYDTRGKCYQQMGQTDEARQDFEAARRMREAGGR